MSLSSNNDNLNNENSDSHFINDDLKRPRDRDGVSDFILSDEFLKKYKAEEEKRKKKNKIVLIVVIAVIALSLIIGLANSKDSDMIPIDEPTATITGGNSPSTTYTNKEYHVEDFEAHCATPSCNTVVDIYFTYCAMHECMIDECLLERDSGSYYCHGHKCLSCTNGKVEDGLYCLVHTCIKEKCLSPKTDSPCSDYCLSHRCHSKDCTNAIKQDGFLYCYEHNCIMPKCNHGKFKNDYCYIHSN